MNYYMGVDGGGTKTAFGLWDETGRLRASITAAGSSYRENGVEAVAELMRNAFIAMVEECSLTFAEVKGAVLALPCVGESRTGDRLLKESLQTTLAPIPVQVVNDVVAGWAGSLNLRSGINIVAGTGSIAYGRNQRKESARCGGWDEFFSDEGSCYWLGRKTLQLFSWQCDGRAEPGPLREILRREFSLEEDFQIIERTVPEITGRRDTTASLQRLLLRAAREGDLTAIRAYEQAAGQLAAMILGVKKQLGLETCPVSYSGGLFHAGELVLKPLERLLEREGCTLEVPRREPWQGAALLCFESFGPEYLAQVMERMEEDGRKGEC